MASKKSPLLTAPVICTTHAFTTKDSTSLSAQYWAPPDGSNSSSSSSNPEHDDPVLLVHGAGASAAVWSRGGDSALALHLARKGYHVWAVDLRTSPTDAAKVEACVLQDIPAAITYILQYHDAKTGPGVMVEKGIARRVNYVGHALGGAIGFSLLATSTCSQLKSLISLGGGASYEPVQSSAFPCVPGAEMYVPASIMDASFELKLALPPITSGADEPKVVDASWKVLMAAAHAQASLNAVPILMLVGDEDKVCKPLYAQRTMAITSRYCYTQKLVVLGEKVKEHQYGGKAFGHYDYLSTDPALASVVQPQITSWLKGGQTINPHRVGDRMLYVKNGVERDALIRACHHDDFPNIYYTIVIDGGNDEKQTDHKNLQVILEDKPAVASPPGCTIA